MTDYNVIGEVGVTPTVKRSEGWMAALAAYSPAVARTPRGLTELVITIPARTFEQAVSTGLAVMLRAAGQLERLEVLTTAEYDRRADDVTVPELVSATQAAEILGVARQRVQQMAADGSLPAAKVGTTLAFPRSTIEAIAEARTAGGRDS